MTYKLSKLFVKKTNERKVVFSKEYEIRPFLINHPNISIKGGVYRVFPRGSQKRFRRFDTPLTSFDKRP